MSALPSLRHALLTCTCPRCGQGPLFKNFLQFHPSCNVCALPLANADSADGPAALLVFVLGFILVPPILFIAMRVDWPLWVHALLWSPLTLLLALALLRPAKALFVAQQFRTRPETFYNQP